jgi:hypothetical protein
MFIVGLILGLFGWGVVRISARMEDRRGEHRVNSWRDTPH